MIAALGLCLLAGLLLGPNFIWKTVSKSERVYPYGLVRRYGYRIETPWGWRHAFRVILYGDTVFVKLTGSMKFQRVLEQRWLCSDRVLYLNLQALHTHSLGTSEFTSKVIYDFERGEMVTFPPGEWGVWPPEGKGDRRPIEGDIESVLTRLSSACQGLGRTESK